MKNVNWRAVAPLLALGAFIVWLIVWTSAQATSAVVPWNGIWLAVLFLGFGLMALAAWLRRQKSNRTWNLMLKDNPDSTHFITFVYPPVTAQLRRMGWRLHGSSYASVPAVGVCFGPTDVTFWEAGAEGPTLTLASSEIKSAALGHVSDGYRSHPAVDLELTTANRGNRLQLNLRNVHHHNLSSEEMKEALRRVPIGPRS